MFSLRRKKEPSQNDMGVCSVTELCSALRLFRLWPTRLLCPWITQVKNTGMSCHFLLQGIFPTQGLNMCLLCLPHCRQILYHGAIGEVQNSEEQCKSPIPFFRFSLPPNKQTGVLTRCSNQEAACWHVEAS